MTSVIRPWIQDFQATISRPLAGAIAEFAKIPVISLQTYEREMGRARSRASALVQQASQERREQLEREVENPAPILSAVMGPFDIANDIRYTYWQAFKIVAADVTIATPLCRLDNRGSGGIILLKFWYRQTADYQYHGDPAGDRYIPPDIVIRTFCDHLATEYHVGFVENESQAIGREGVVESNQELLHSGAEHEARAVSEHEARRRKN